MFINIRLFLDKYMYFNNDGYGQLKMRDIHLEPNMFIQRHDLFLSKFLNMIQILI